MLYKRLWGTVSKFIKSNWHDPSKFDLFVFHRPETYQKFTSVKKKSLPQPPLPDLDKTLDSYLQYASVIASDHALSIGHKLTEEFRKNAGLKAQHQLATIAEKEDNWVNKFWLSEMYLKNRACLPIYSNPAYIFPKHEFLSLDCQARYAAALIRGLLDFKDKIDRHELELDRLGDKTPMSMHQYDSVFNTYRTAALDEDVHERRINDTNYQYIMVMCKNQVFVMDVIKDGECLSLNVLTWQLSQIQWMAMNNLGQAFPIGLITAGERDMSAQATNILMQDPVNEDSMKLVKGACFAVCLDSGHIEGGDVEANQAIQMLTGFPSKDYCNRWHEKTLQVIISKHGYSGLCIEHSVAEGIVLIRMVESALKDVQKMWSGKHQLYAPTPPHTLKPKPLTWHISEQLRNIVADIQSDMIKLLPSLDLEVLHYTKYGKDFAKRMKMSPDALIQLGLQLAHYKLHGKLVSTYESASIRRFRYGRVDNIRSAHPQALHWVKLMVDDKATKEQKYKAFETALAKQTQVMKENITGHGIDNHLAALWSICQQETGKMPDIFKDEVSRELLRFPLSTSSVPTSIKDTFLCYGPVVDDGYGCAYSPKNDRITFAVSSLALCQHTDSKNFNQSIAQALDQLQEFLEENRVLT